MKKTILSIFLALSSLAVGAKSYDVVESTTFYGRYDKKGIKGTPVGWTVEKNDNELVFIQDSTVILEFKYAHDPVVKGNLTTRKATESRGIYYSPFREYDIMETVDSNGYLLVGWMFKTKMKFLFKLKEKE